MNKGLYITTVMVLIAPLLALIYLSVVGQWEYPKLLDNGFTLRHWVELIAADFGLGPSLGRSVLLAISMATLCSVLGFSLSRKISENKSLLGLAFYPYLIAPVVFGAMLQFYFVRMGINGTLVGVGLAQFLFIFPYSVLLFSTFWNDRVRQTAFQATTLGASDWKVLQTVLVPMALPWILLCFVQCFLISWFEFGITQLIGLGKVETLTIRTMWFVKEANPHLAAVSSLLMVLPLLVLLIFNRSLFLKRVQ